MLTPRDHVTPPDGEISAKLLHACLAFLIWVGQPVEHGESRVRRLEGIRAVAGNPARYEIQGDESLGVAVKVAEPADAVHIARPVDVTESDALIDGLSWTEPP